MPPERDRRGFWRANGLTLCFGAAFLVVLGFQAVAGRAEFNEQLALEGLQQIGFGDYLMSSDFAVDVTENWQSEFLQFFLYIFGTVYLLQRGSPESKPLQKAGSESDREQRMGDRARGLSPVGRYEGLAAGPLLQVARSHHGHLLRPVLAGAVDLGRRRLQRTASAAAPDARHLALLPRLGRLLEPVAAELAVGAPGRGRDGHPLGYLRHRGSPESKPVGAMHEATGVEG